MKNSNDKILIVALSGIGDALLFTPALEELKKIKPESEIDALVMFKGAEDIFRRQKEINKVFYFDFLNMNPLKVLAHVLSFRKRYDASINVYPANRREYNLISLLIGAKDRGTVKYLRKDFSNFGFLNNLRTPENDSLHNVEENINIVKKLTSSEIENIPPLSFPLDDDEKRSAENYLGNINISDSDLVIGFHAGCATLKNHINRRWSPENFAELGRKLINDHNAKILIFGGPDEEGLNKVILDYISSEKAFVVKTNALGETAAIMKRCNIFVSNDSSLMHLSAAMQLNTVAVIGPTNLNYIHPWKTEYKTASISLDCAPCFYYSPRPLTCTRDDIKFKCIKELNVDLVYSKVLKFLK